MIIGAHSIIYSTQPDADLRVLRDVLRFPYVDAGRGWLIFGLPPGELAVHPAEKNDRHELYLMCDDIQAFVADMRKQRLECTPVEEQRWGLLTHLVLPGGGRLGVYEPRHPHPKPAAKRKAAVPAAAGAPKKPRRKSTKV